MRRAPPAAGREGGFTLVEMLVALALFGLIASAAVGLTRAGLMAQARSAQALAQISALARARSLLAADLGQALPRASLADDGRPMPAFVLTPSGFVMVRGGLSGVLPSAQKIAWGFDGERLLRQAWPAIDGTAPGPATALVGGLQAASFRVPAPGGWSDAWEAVTPDALPEAIEVVLVPRSGPPARFVLAVAS